MKMKKLQSILYNKITRISVHTLGVLFLFLIHFTFNIPWLYILPFLFPLSIIPISYEFNAWNYRINKGIEKILSDLESGNSELSKYVTVYTINKRGKIVFKNVLKEDFEREENEKSNTFLVSELEKNITRDYEEIEYEKRNYMSLLELVDKYKKLEKMENSKFSNINTAEAFDISDTSSYSYIKK